MNSFMSNDKKQTMCSSGVLRMCFHLIFNSLQKKRILFLILFCFLVKLEAENSRENNGTYYNLNKALQNPLDVLALELYDSQLTTLPKEIEQLQNLES